MCILGTVLGVEACWYVKIVVPSVGRGVCVRTYRGPTLTGCLAGDSRRLLGDLQIYYRLF